MRSIAEDSLTTVGPLPRVVAAVSLAAIAACSGGGGGGGSATAPAGDTISWSDPTTRTDGTRLTNLSWIVIRWGAQGGPYDAGQQTVTADSTSVFIPQPAGLRTTCYVAIAVDANGLESAESNATCRTVGP